MSCTNAQIVTFRRPSVLVDQYFLNSVNATSRNLTDGAGSRIINPLTDEANRMFGGASVDKRAFVKVEAGRPAYVMVADLPKDRAAVDAPGEDELPYSGSLTDFVSTRSTVNPGHSPDRLHPH